MEDVNKLRTVAIDVGAMAVETDVGATAVGKKTNTEIVWPQRLNEQEPQEHIDLCPSLRSDLSLLSSVGVPLTQHTSTHDAGKIGVVLCSCSVKMDELCSCSSNMDAKHGDMAVGNEGGMAAEKEGNVVAAEKEGNSGKEGHVVSGKKVVKPKYMSEKNLWRVDDRNMDLLRPNLTWDQVVVKVLHMMRCREFTEKNEKLSYDVPTRFCPFNMAFFDLDKESKVVPRKRMMDVHVSDSSDWWIFEDSVNIISVGIAESDVNYPINIYGTILARDEYDYRCIYLFKRDRDNPQLIESEDDTLTLTGPFRALAVTGTMYFEFHLKIKCDGAVDKDFSKGFFEHNTSRRALQPMTRVLRSCLSEVEMVYSPVPFAMEHLLRMSRRGW